MNLHKIDVAKILAPNGSVRRALGALSAKLLGSLLALFLGIVVARLLGANSAGIYYLAMAVITFLGSIGRAGLDFVVIRRMAAGIADGSWAQAHGCLRECLGHSATLSSVFAIALVLAAPWLADSVFHKPELRIALQLGAFAVVPFAMINLFSASLKAQIRPGAAQTVESTLLPGFTLIAIPIAVWLLPENAAISGYLFGTIAAASVGWLISRHGPLKQSAISARVGGLWKAGSPFIGTTVINQIMTWSPVFILGYMAHNSEIAIYTSSARLALAVSLALVAINSASVGIYAKLYHEGNINGLNKEVRRSTIIGFIIGAPIMIALALGAEMALGLYGDEFIAGSNILRIILIGQLFNVIMGPLGQVLSISKNESYLMGSFAIGLTVQLLLLLLLTPNFGGVGVALSQSASAIVINIAAFAFTRTRLGINIFGQGRRQI